MQLQGIQMLTTTLQDPIQVKTYLRAFGLRYTFWYLNEMCNCSIGRTVYLLILSI